MKTIGIDYSPAQINPAGIGQYSLNITRELLKIDNINSYILYSYKKIEDFKLPPNAKNIVIPLPLKYPGKGFRYMLKVKDSLIKEEVDLMLSYSNHSFALLFNKTILFIHDLAPIKYSKYFPVSARVYYPITTKLASKKALKIIAVSKFIKKEIIKYTGINKSKIDVVYPSINEDITNNIKKVNDIPSEYILSISTLEPRKNYELAIKAFSKLLIKNPNLKYLIIGKKGWYYENIFKTVLKNNLQDKVIFLGYKPNDEIAYIIKNAKALIYISEYEGFGIPPLEAIYFNTPIILSNIPIFKEVFDNYANFVDLNDFDNIVNTIHKVINSKKKEYNRELINKYSWNNSANKLKEIISKL